MGLDKKFETGILWQDTQHRQLIDLMEKKRILAQEG